MLQDEDPRDAEWGGEIPEAVLGRGWLDVVRYLLKLEDGAGLLKRVRLQVMGAGRVGKTSLVRALGAEDGKTEAIDVDDRTVGILVEELVLGEATGVMWDLAGQQEYRALHAALISARYRHSGASGGGAERCARCHWLGERGVGLTRAWRGAGAWRCFCSARTRMQRKRSAGS